MVSKFESFNESLNEWVRVGDVPPGQKGSLSNNLPDGKREIYIFECAKDDSHTTLYKAPFGLDAEIDSHRLVADLAGDMHVLAVLNKGEEPHVLSIKTDVSPTRRKVRISHI